MASYNYDESGIMAAYFLITFLLLILVPMTLSISPSRQRKKTVQGCQCRPCIEQSKRVEKRRTVLSLSKKSMFLISGWALCAFLTFKVANSKSDIKVYNPFEILGIATSATEKEIKSHYKKLSKMYHPDKVRATANETIEMIQDRFVGITKAYKALTDVVIRENYIKYGHPDGRQELSMGIALPQWIVESKNNIWVLGFYGLIFGGGLPAIVGSWWFGSRQKTKDGVNVKSAAAFFKGLKEESGEDEVLGTLAKAFQWEAGVKKGKKNDDEVKKLEAIVSKRAGKRWENVLGVAGKDASVKRSLVLLYAYLLRLPMESSELQKEQIRILLQLPLLLGALLNVTMVRGWLQPTLAVLRLQAYIAQALTPGNAKFAQLPNVKPEESLGALDMDEVVKTLEKNGDSRVDDVKKAVQRWGRLEIVDATFKVAGERIITPSSFVHLLVKVRIAPPTSEDTEDEPRSEETEERDNKFLSSKGEAEDIGDVESSWAHAPYWPAHRKPSWYLFTLDEHKNRIIVPPTKITDVPMKGDKRGYRSFKVQFQAPPNTGTVQWRLWIVSDTFVGEEVSRIVSFKIDDFSALNADEQAKEDEISDPEEDSIAGQMAVMRGEKVKRVTEEDEESDEESSTDDDEQGDDSDSSDDD